MTDRMMALAAFLVLAAFAGILLWYIPRLDLGAVIVLTILLAGWDFFGPRR